MKLASEELGAWLCPVLGTKDDEIFQGELPSTRQTAFTQGVQYDIMQPSHYTMCHMR
jgi:hypothetical protein